MSQELVPVSPKRKAPEPNCVYLCNLCGTELDDHQLLCPKLKHSICERCYVTKMCSVCRRSECCDVRFVKTCVACKIRYCPICSLRNIVNFSSSNSPRTLCGNHLFSLKLRSFEDFAKKEYFGVIRTVANVVLARRGMYTVLNKHILSFLPSEPEPGYSAAPYRFVNGHGINFGALSCSWNFVRFPFQLRVSWGYGSRVPRCPALMMSLQEGKWELADCDLHKSHKFPQRSFSSFIEELHVFYAKPPKSTQYIDDAALAVLFYGMAYTVAANLPCGTEDTFRLGLSRQ